MADDLSGLSYEAALGELDEIIARLERGDVELEAAISAYERGAALTRHCAQLLDRTEQKITQLVVGPAGEVERPFQPPAARAETPAAPPSRGGAEQRLFGEPAPVPTPRGVPVNPDDIPF
ncbi:MAG TPA: exodeoxyribonuclease VII small subunit [Candidatus Deferrimicrobium sp.]|nr:exodeoxyribonuclease VII small subunit [Candidatus Deferrimicrobium sp.]